MSHHIVRTTPLSPLSALRTGLAVLCLFGAGGTAYGEPLLWYGGDGIASGFFNNTVESASFGYSILDDFVVSEATGGWHVTSLFSNNFAAANVPFTQAAWSIRTGVGPGDPGDTLFAGISPVTVAPTGRIYHGPAVEYVEYRVAVSGLSLDLVPGIYFMNVSPVAQVPVYYVSDSDGTNAVGTAGPSDFLQEQRDNVNGVPQHLILDTGAPRASMGVNGSVALPEPGALAQTGLGIVVALLGSAWRNRKGSVGVRNCGVCACSVQDERPFRRR
jgi:hypothetical protein